MPKKVMLYFIWKWPTRKYWWFVSRKNFEGKISTTMCAMHKISIILVRKELGFSKQSIQRENILTILKFSIQKCRWQSLGDIIIKVGISKIWSKRNLLSKFLNSAANHMSLTFFLKVPFNSKFLEFLNTILQIKSCSTCK